MCLTCSFKGLLSEMALLDVVVMLCILCVRRMEALATSKREQEQENRGCIPQHVSAR